MLPSGSAGFYTFSLNLLLYFDVSGHSGLGSAGGPAAGESGLDQEVLWPRDLQRAVEEPVCGPERRPALHLRQGGETIIIIYVYMFIYSLCP